MPESPGRGDVHRAEYRIEDLSRRSGATVRTIRAYQDRGLLPKPTRRGRANVYDDTHLARLRQIADLLDRGYTLASIKELLEAWDEGRGLGGVLGLVTEVEGPWTDEEPGRLTRAELTAMFSPRSEAACARPGAAGEHGAGQEPGTSHEFSTSDEREVPAYGTQAKTGEVAAGEGEGPREGLQPNTPTTPLQAIEEAVALGVLVPLAGRPDEFLVPSPQELAVAAELHAAGVPLGAITGHLRELRGQVEHIASRFVDFTNEHVFIRYVGVPPTDADVTEAAELVRRLRPLAQQTVDAELARAMQTLASRNLRDHLRTATAHPSFWTEPDPRPAEPAPEPEEAEPPVHLPARTLAAVRSLVGEENVAAFITAAAEREVQARTMDRLADPAQQ
ncbi:MerR family transcriptional regulator [Streptomyces sp. HNM0574]|uniref:MerR family transcriptional regulator n=1 Tax=Streptomyces sp. HNM0574 TaxID=2714954 RepID=UPI003217C684